MQFIEKGEIQPSNWDLWFTKANGQRSFNYFDYESLPNIVNAKRYLLQEQHGLCAYCQTLLTEDQASIEHLIPKSLNRGISTNYHNLVVVCKNPISDPITGRKHCDKERGSELLIPIVFYSNSLVTRQENHTWFDVGSDGSIFSKSVLKHEVKSQVDSFIEITNLNHSVLKQKRSKDLISGILEVFRQIPTHQRKVFWKSQFERIFLCESHPFRQYLLIYISKKLGRN